MIPSILQLKEHVFLKTNVELNKYFNPNKEYSVEAKHISCNIMSGYNEQDDYYSIELALVIDAKTSKKANLPYRVSLVSAGIVTLGKTEGDRETLAVVNGCSLFYSSMREYLMFLTSRYPYGHLFLPTVNFQGLVKKQVQENKSN